MLDEANGKGSDQQLYWQCIDLEAPIKSISERGQSV
jgi:hypothetical protein